jgi:hypothetical protein
MLDVSSLENLRMLLHSLTEVTEFPFFFTKPTEGLVLA